MEASELSNKQDSSRPFHQGRLKSTRQAFCQNSKTNQRETNTKKRNKRKEAERKIKQDKRARNIREGGREEETGKREEKIPLLLICMGWSRKGFIMVKFLINQNLVRRQSPLFLHVELKQGLCPLSRCKLLSLALHQSAGQKTRPQPNKFLSIFWTGLLQFQSSKLFYFQRKSAS